MAKTPDELARDILTIENDRRDWLQKAPIVKGTPQRKRYEKFNPYPTSIPIDPKNPGGSPDVVGADRVYALYQHALDNDLDFARVFAHDRERYPDRTPNVLEFENDKFELFPGSSGGDYFKKKNGNWEHVSRGTRYGENIFDLLGKGDFK